MSSSLFSPSPLAGARPSPSARAQPVSTRPPNRTDFESSPAAQPLFKPVVGVSDVRSKVDLICGLQFEIGDSPQPLYGSYLSSGPESPEDTLMLVPSSGSSAGRRMLPSDFDVARAAKRPRHESYEPQPSPSFPLMPLTSPSSTDLSRWRLPPPNSPLRPAAGFQYHAEPADESSVDPYRVPTPPVASTSRLPASVPTATFGVPDLALLAGPRVHVHTQRQTQAYRDAVIRAVRALHHRCPICVLLKSPGDNHTPFNCPAFKNLWQAFTECRSALRSAKSSSQKLPLAGSCFVCWVPNKDVTETVRHQPVKASGGFGLAKAPDRCELNDTVLEAAFAILTLPGLADLRTALQEPFIAPTDTQRIRDRLFTMVCHAHLALNVALTCCLDSRRLVVLPGLAAPVACPFIKSRIWVGARYVAAVDGQPRARASPYHFVLLDLKLVIMPSQ